MEKSSSDSWIQNYASSGRVIDVPNGDIKNALQIYDQVTGNGNQKFYMDLSFGQ